MQDYHKTGMAYSELLASNMIDNFVRLWLISYYWPYFVAGNIDDWMKMGITLNGLRPMCSR